jgi:hypothetical protein
MWRAADRFLSAFTDDVIVLEVPPLPPDVHESARAWVIARVNGAMDVTRLGLAVAGTGLALAVRLGTGRRYDQLVDERRLAIARRLTRTRLPIAAEYVRAVRSLVVSYVYEARAAAGP